MNKSVRSAAHTRTRLLNAAIQVFALMGFKGATTREIASVAEVSEMTLFRHFPSKNELLCAVVQHIMQLQLLALEHQDELTYNLHIDLSCYARLYNAMLEEHEDFTRIVLQERHQYPEEVCQVIQQVVDTRNEKLIVYLRDAQVRGMVRQDLDLNLAVDLFMGMLVTGTLRHSLTPNEPKYSRESYLDGCVDFFVRAISTLQGINSQYSSV